MSGRVPEIVGEEYQRYLETSTRTVSAPFCVVKLGGLHTLHAEHSSCISLLQVQDCG